MIKLVKPYAASNQFKQMEEKGFFLSRVPCSVGEKNQYLLILRKQVFTSKDGKTYTAFVEKSTRPIILNNQFGIVGVADRPYADKLFQDHYDLSAGEAKITEKIRGAASKQGMKMPHKPQEPAIPIKMK